MTMTASLDRLSQRQSNSSRNMVCKPGEDETTVSTADTSLSADSGSKQRSRNPRKSPNKKKKQQQEQPSEDKFADEFFENADAAFPTMSFPEPVFDDSVDFPEPSFDSTGTQKQEPRPRRRASHDGCTDLGGKSGSRRAGRRKSADGSASGDCRRSGRRRASVCTSSLEQEPSAASSVEFDAFGDGKSTSEKHEPAAFVEFDAFGHGKSTSAEHQPEAFVEFDAFGNGKSTSEEHEFAAEFGYETAEPTSAEEKSHSGESKRRSSIGVGSLETTKPANSFECKFATSFADFGYHHEDKQQETSKPPRRSSSGCGRSGIRRTRSDEKLPRPPKGSADKSRRAGRRSSRQGNVLDGSDHPVIQM